MESAPPPLAADTWDGLPPEVQVLILGLQAQVTALQERIHDLETRLGQDSSNSCPTAVF